MLVTDIVVPDGPSQDSAETHEQMLESMTMMQVPAEADFRQGSGAAGLDIVEVSDLTERGQEAADILDMRMSSIDVRYLVIVGDRRRVF